MNPNLCRLVLRPRGPFEVFDLALRLTRVRWWPLLVLGLWTLLPWAVISTVACWVFEGHWALLAIPLVAGPFLQAPFTLLVGRLLFADDVKVGEVIWDTLRRTPSLVGAWSALGAGVAASSLTCFYGVPVVQGTLMFLTETALLERVPLSRGAGRSLRLAGAGVAQTTAGVAVRWALLIWCAMVGEATGQAVVGFVFQLGSPFGSAQDLLVTPYLLIGLLISHPLWAVYRLLLYVDVRTRTEGWDLQVGLRAAGLER